MRRSGVLEAGPGEVLTSLALPHLLNGTNPHVLTLSPPLDMDRRGLRDPAPYTVSKYAMTMLTLGYSVLPAIGIPLWVNGAKPATQTSSLNSSKRM